MFEMIPYSRQGRSLFDPWSDLDDWGRRWLEGSGQPAWFGFSADLRQQGDNYVIEAELPGFEREDIEVTVYENRLTITARRQDSEKENQAQGENQDERGGYLRRERRWGRFSRSFELSGVDAEQIQASYSNGLLTLVLPRQEKRQPQSRRIDIH